VREFFISNRVHYEYGRLRAGEIGLHRKKHGKDTRPELLKIFLLGITAPIRSPPGVVASLYPVKPGAGFIVPGRLGHADTADILPG
jgi:hypothetical protein